MFFVILIYCKIRWKTKHEFLSAAGHSQRGTMGGGDIAKFLFWVTHCSRASQVLMYDNHLHSVLFLSPLDKCLMPATAVSSLW